MAEDIDEWRESAWLKPAVFAANNIKETSVWSTFYIISFFINTFLP